MTDSDLVQLDNLAATCEPVRNLLVSYAALRAELLVQADKRAELERALGEACDIASKWTPWLLVGLERNVDLDRIIELRKLLAQQEPK